MQLHDGGHLRGEMAAVESLPWPTIVQRQFRGTSGRVNAPWWAAALCNRFAPTAATAPSPASRPASHCSSWSIQA